MSESSNDKVKSTLVTNEFDYSQYTTRQDEQGLIKVMPTLGQMAEQIQAKARSAALASGTKTINDFKEEDESFSDNVDVCPSGREATGRWTIQEHELFLEALKKYGKEWKKVAAMVKTRSVVQTRTHAQKYFQKVQKVGVNGDGMDVGLDVCSTYTAATKSSKRLRKKRRVATQNFRTNTNDWNSSYDEYADEDDNGYEDGGISGSIGNIGNLHTHALHANVQGVCVPGIPGTVMPLPTHNHGHVQTSHTTTVEEDIQALGLASLSRHNASGRVLHNSDSSNNSNNISTNISSRTSPKVSVESTTALTPTLIGSLHQHLNNSN